MASGQLSYQVLLIEDDPGYTTFMKEMLEKAELATFLLESVDCLADALAAMREHDFDIVLLDLGLTAHSGFEVLDGIHTARPEIPVVVLTTATDEAMAVEAVAQGAQEYVYKSDLSCRCLERVVRYAVQKMWMLQELQAANRLLDQKNKRLAKLNETAYQFVDNVSHEFRTPLTVIREFVTILCDGLAGPISDQQREFLEIVNDRVDDLAIMVDDMLDVSKLEAGLLSIRRKESRITTIIEHVRPSLERKAAIKRVALDIAIADDLPVIYCDPEKTGRVIINLITNAIKFCGDRGKVRLWARRGDASSDVVVGVTDNGPGIAPEDSQRIFERFRQIEGTTQNSTKGFGLGLSIAKDLVGLNFGRIELDSELGQGSTFRFTVPIWCPCSLLSRQVEWMTRGEGPGSATLIVAEVDALPDAANANVVDEFVQHVFRATDLIVRIFPNKWLIVAACSHSEVDDQLQRIRRAWAEANRNRPGSRLPEVELHAVGSWLLPIESDKLSQHFEVELSRRRPDAPMPSILVVDDDQDTRRGLEIRLTAAGYQVLTAADGLAAIRSAQHHRPDAILMDKFMPGMDGVAALNRLVRDPSTKSIPVIMLSASLRDQQKMLEQGARFFLQKPCTAATVMAALREVIEGPGPTISA